jgi:hypothetical protein
MSFAIIPYLCVHATSYGKICVLCGKVANTGTQSEKQGCVAKGCAESKLQQRCAPQTTGLVQLMRWVKRQVLVKSGGACWCARN